MHIDKIVEINGMNKKKKRKKEAKTFFYRLERKSLLENTAPIRLNEVVRVSSAHFFLIDKLFFRGNLQEEERRERERFR